MNKGIARAKKDRKRAEAVARNAAFQALPLEEKISRNSTRFWNRIPADQWARELLAVQTS